MATILSIAYQPLGSNYDDPFDKFIRIPAQSARLIAGHGIEGDQKAGHARSRQLNIIPTDWLAVRKGQGYRTEPGEMGEQLIIDGLEFATMSPGMRLQIGDQAVIELASPRIGCERLDAAQPRPVPNAIKQAGIGFMARVIAGGEIRIGDPVMVIETVTES